MSKRIHQPPDALLAPRFTGPRTVARLPLVEALNGVDRAVVGLPWDGGTSYRPGARFGPEAIRSASSLLRPYNPAQGAQVFGALSAIDHGDAPTVPGYIEDTLARIERFLAPIAAAGVVPLGMGGDHSVTLAELRALAAAHGPLGLLHLDAHADLWDSYNERPLSHGTFARRAIEEGVVDASRTLLAGLRGPLYGPEDVASGRELGVAQLRCEELLATGPERFGERAREALGEGPAFFTFDVDFLDPAFCPATGTPEVGGPTSREALAFVRALRGIHFVGFDVVEVAPQYDGPGQQTALFAANVLYEMLTLAALDGRS
ncbi:MAG TPA: agmatinase [Solirubrobacterales bacterium]|nr:agmatinase [Solirubrobacterales bacterium]